MVLVGDCLIGGLTGDGLAELLLGDSLGVEFPAGEREGLEFLIGDGLGVDPLEGDGTGGDVLVRKAVFDGPD